MILNALLPFTSRARQAAARRREQNKQDIYGAIIKCQLTNRYLLVLGRHAMKWSFPKGHIKENESEFECLIREVYEETGFIDLPVPVGRKKLRVGKYYLINIDHEFTVSPVDTNEIAEGKWMTIDEIRSITMNIDTSYYFNNILKINQLEPAIIADESVLGNIINIIEEPEQEQEQEQDPELQEQEPTPDMDCNTEDPCNT